MQAPDIPTNEARRLQALRDLEVLDTPAEESFDRLTELAREIFGVPVALISLIDTQRQWFKSHPGVDACETGLDVSFCAHAVADDDTLVVTDLTDSRFADNPLVAGAPHIRFYAGHPLRPLDDMPVGTLCLLDYHPRTFSAHERRLLAGLAGQAEALLRQNKLSADLAHTAKRFETIFFTSATAKVRIDRNGRMIAINPFALNLLGYVESDVVGQNVAMLAPPDIHPHHDGYIQRYLDGHEPRVIGKGREVEAMHKDGHRVPVHLAINAIHDEHGQVEEFLGVLTDLRDIQAANRRIQKEQALLSVLHQGITDYQALMSGKKLWTFLMEALRELTDSDYALIGEVLPGDNGNALKVHAITDLAWSPSSRQLMEQLRSGNMMFTRADTLLGRVYAQGEVVMTDDLYQHPQRGGLPPGHPVLDNYLGVPIYSGSELIGMYAISNSRQTLDQSLLHWLEPFTATCALLINLYRQMAERDQVLQDLAHAHDQAQRANQAKSEFLSSMSHELRTPLNAILGFAQLLASGRREPLSDKQTRQVNQIEKSGQHLLSLINEVLDLAKIESGHMPLSLETITLAHVIEDVCQTLEPSAEASGIRLACTPPPAESQVCADYTRVKQVLFNLISNAIKYNSPNGSIQITAAPRDDALSVSVTDTGPGIAAHRRHELFEPFNRLDAENGPVEGTGIGLAITRELVERMGGIIDVDSAPGEGSTFWFTLPRSNEDAAARAHGEATRPASEFQQQTLIYVEDNPANQRLMEDIIDDVDGLVLRTAPSAEMGLELLRITPAALVMMDIHLPGMDGYQALAAIRRDPHLQALPVVALSASAMQRDINKALDAGFDAYLTKPLEIAKLMATLKRYVIT
ncbi:ATP-binding protein [Vreelandella subglaciescola]|uniref:histidine kinase n=1 Tax=Vreelandella subglaciescola TaxID=29571 RepID=A0A1M7G0J2_9GAMM|nr:ATP-binding protein [Halomonas subglaciescola]SHM09884.1 PAS domain S-box-containing protein [Halomonas subglaciescola]